MKLVFVNKKPPLKLFKDMCQDIYVMENEKKKAKEFIMRMPIGKADYQIYYICLYIFFF